MALPPGLACRGHRRWRAAARRRPRAVRAHLRPGQLPGVVRGNGSTRAARRPVDPRLMPTVVETYLDAIQAHDWPRLRECVTDDIVRVGPFGDSYEGRDAYVGFISEL